MTLTAEPKFTVKETADGSPTVFLEDLDGIGLLISFQLRPGATIENARAVANFLNKEVRQITVQSDYDLAV
jgi:hypothetical protein